MPASDAQAHRGCGADMTDAELVRAAQSGVDQAFAMLAERHYAPLLRHLTRQVGDPDLAADLTHDSFLDAQRKLGTLGGDRPFAAWLYRIARLNLLHAWRARTLRRLVSLDRLLGTGGTGPPTLRQADASAACHEREALARALDGLSPALREALLLHRLWGLTTDEVAGALGISPAAAGHRIGRAQEHFRRRYRDAERGDDDHLR